VSLASYLLVGLGSAFGGMARFGVSDIVFRLTASEGGPRFPWGTLIANVSGCFLIALLAAFVMGDGRPLLDTAGRQLLMVGFLGGYTTFSAFLELALAGDWTGAGLNVGLSVVLCLAAVYLGWLAGGAVSG
jgi:CrcB protein